MTVMLDGRLEEGSDDPDPKHFAIAICDDFTTDQKFELQGGKRSGKNKREGNFLHMKITKNNCFLSWHVL